MFNVKLCLIHILVVFCCFRSHPLCPSGVCVCVVGHQYFGDGRVLSVQPCVIVAAFLCPCLGRVSHRTESKQQPEKKKHVRFCCALLLPRPADYLDNGNGYTCFTRFTASGIIFVVRCVFFPLFFFSLAIRHSLPLFPHCTVFEGSLLLLLCSGSQTMAWATLAVCSSQWLVQPHRCVGCSVQCLVAARRTLSLSSHSSHPFPLPGVSSRFFFVASILIHILELTFIPNAINITVNRTPWLTSMWFLAVAAKNPCKWIARTANGPIRILRHSRQKLFLFFSLFGCCLVALFMCEWLGIYLVETRTHTEPQETLGNILSEAAKISDYPIGWISHASLNSKEIFDFILENTVLFTCFLALVCHAFSHRVQPSTQ